MKTQPLKLSEYAEQCLFIKYLDILKIQGKIVMYTAINPRPNIEHIGQRMKAKKAGLNPGFPDLFIIYKNRFHDFKAICIEMKIKPNKVTPEQDTWHKALAQTGIKVYTAWGYDSAKICIDSEL